MWLEYFTVHEETEEIIESCNYLYGDYELRVTGSESRYMRNIK